MDIKAKVDEVVAKIKADDNLGKKFLAAPVKTLEDLLGVDLPDEQAKALIAGIKDKIDLEAIGGKLNALGDKIEDKLDGKVDFEAIGDKLGDLGGKVGDTLNGLFGKK